jgi:hypothetical protein
MTETIKEMRNENPMKILGMIILSLPSILFRFAGEYLRFRSKANKGGSIFQNELLSQGLDESTAKSLTEVYLEGSNFIKNMTSLRRWNYAR